MTIGMRRLAVVTALMLLVAGVAGRAYGFFPMGGFNFNQQLRYATWSFKEFDTNENGIIEPGEGLEFRIEGGPRGFTLAEIEQVKAAFKTWEDVPTSYVAFRLAGIIEDPIVPGIGAPDYLPTIFMQVTGVAEDDGYTQLDPVDVLVPGLGGPVLATVLTLYSIDITVVPVGGNQVFVPAGTILDCDVVVNATAHRPGFIETDTSMGPADLQATMTHAVGQLLGLSYTPLNNLDPTITLEEGLGLPVEPAVLQMTGADGEPRMMGATPVMFPGYFFTQMPDGALQPGWLELAPDDISGVSWLYPREDGLENFFSIQHEARTHVRSVTGIPPAPISGAHIVAWGDVGDGVAGRRVPLFSTMTGMYNLHSNIQMSGRFNLMGLWKQMEIPGKAGEFFEPSYVITMSPLSGLGLERQSPPGMGATMFDSIQGTFPASFTLYPRPAGYFSTNYPSEVFNEEGNIYGVDNNPAGTPLVWSFERNALISANSGKTLPRMLRGNAPMFGSPDKVCPMNIIENADGVTIPTGIAGLNDNLRGFRDNTLLASAPGTAMVDLYYRVAPFISAQLLRHDGLLRAATGGIAFLLWVWEHSVMLYVLAMLLLTAVYVSVKRRRIRLVGKVAALILVLVCVAVAVNAAQLPLTTEALVAESGYIVSGEVVSAEGFQARDGRIYTDVVFEVTDVAKGDLNRGMQLNFTVIGGTYGTLALRATGIPGFVEGEHAVLHLVDVPDYGLVPYGGVYSKVPIYVDPETGEEEVVVENGDEEAPADDTPAEEENGDDVEDNGDDDGDEATDEDADDDGDDDVADDDNGDDDAEDTVEEKRGRTIRTGRMPVRDYMRYLRAIANSQR